LKSVLITQSNYIPWKGYFDAINTVDQVILYDDAQYTKRDWRNRNVIQTANGLQWLSIPVDVKGKFLQRIRETKISDPSWNERHWKTLQSNYSRAPHFKDVKDFIAHLYLQATMPALSEINHWFLTEICKWLNIQTPLEFSHGYDLTAENPTERLVNICKTTGASHYYTGPAAKAYLEEQKFINENIKVCYLNYDGYPEYPQLYTPFNHHVTILDLLFNTGRESTKYMKSFR
jgi:hypothetical protein